MLYSNVTMAWNAGWQPTFGTAGKAPGDMQSKGLAPCSAGQQAERHVRRPRWHGCSVGRSVAALSVFRLLN